MLTKDLFSLKDKVILITGSVGLYGRGAAPFCNVTDGEDMALVMFGSIKVNIN
jgi:hypothetical protein